MGKQSLRALGVNSDPRPMLRNVDPLKRASSLFDTNSIKARRRQMSSEDLVRRGLPSRPDGRHPDAQFIRDVYRNWSCHRAGPAQEEEKPVMSRLAIAVVLTLVATAAN